MKLFILDTATAVFSMAIADGSRVLAEEGGVAGPSSAARLAPAISGLFARAGLTPVEMDCFAVTVGPGAFTGLRVGISLVKGLAHATAKPVIPLSSLALLAMNANHGGLHVCPMFDARKGEVYAALYRFTPAIELLLAESAVDPAAFLRQLEGRVLFLGDGSVRYRSLIEELMGERAKFADAQLNNPCAATGINLATQIWNTGGAVSSKELLPRYLRLSEAELSRR